MPTHINNIQRLPILPTQQHIRFLTYWKINMTTTSTNLYEIAFGRHTRGIEAILTHDERFYND